MRVLLVILSAAIGYLFGTIPVGACVARVYGNLDIRKHGSGNTGTTNVLRTLGWVPSLLTLLGDCLKGVCAALVGRWLGGEAGMLAGGFFAVLGHDFPVFSGFRGGKGIATSLGITFVICTPVAPWLVGIVIAIVAAVRIMSVGTLAASIAYPILFWIYLPEGASLPLYLAFSLATAALSFFCHRSNLRRLLRGEENRLDFGKIAEISRKYMHLPRRGKKR